ncbi:ABC transporter ATP-binding protein [Thermopolyspora sp. NPDC052614]|uniref:ABC transporter ATP-binding protein n=1 Tax=Thermopolyspora sp. NPDC052614 TaxID=3155682 RepID=UPI00342F4C27
MTVDDLTVAFGHGRNRLVAVDRVSLGVPHGAALGVVGESGSGKSTLGRAIAGLVAPAGGEIRLDGRLLPPRRSRSDLRRIQLAFQNAGGSLSPRMPVARILGDAVAAAGVPRERRRDRVDELLEAVQLPTTLRDALPGRLSGGQRQRVALARALASEPEFLICDEVTSALDVSARGAMLNLLIRLRRQYGWGLIFISHDIAAVRQVSDDIAVMYLGRTLELGPGEAVVAAPRHPYTRTLIEAIPVLGEAPAGPPDDVDPPDPRHPPTGCPFHTRCPLRPRAEPAGARCVTDEPTPITRGLPHHAACHFPPPLERT